VKVLAPGSRGAEGEEKGKGVTARWGLKEAQSNRAGRRTGTGYEVWPTRDERARDREVLPPHWGVLYKSGVYAPNVLGLTSGRSADCPKERTEAGGTRPDRSAEVSQGHRRSAAGTASEAPQGRKAG
jgi:hypothetical protein